MNPLVGWGLALAALGIGWALWSWQGLALAASAIVFWLLLQFNRAVRAMRSAAAAPVGHVPSAVMLNARLAPSMTMLQIVGLTRSLGAKRSDVPEVWVWTDPGGASVAVTLERGRVARWALERPGAPDAAP